LAQRLQHQNTEDTTDTINWSSPQEQRYDHDAVQKVVDLASRLQSQHAETLTAQQVETIGEEVGVDPVFIRRALALMEEEQSTEVVRTAQPAQLHAPLTGSSNLTPLSSRGKWIATAMPFAYGALSYVGFSSHDSNRSEIEWALCFVMAPTLAVILGAGLKNPRLGTLSGGLIAVSMWVAAILAHGGAVPSAQELPLIVTFLVSGMTIGGVSASVSKRWAQIKASASICAPQR